MKNISKTNLFILGLLFGGLYVCILYAIIDAYESHHSGAIIFFSIMCGVVSTATVLIAASIDQSNQ